MTEKKVQDKRVHALAGAVKPHISVGEKKFLFTDDAAQSLVDAFNEENGDKKPQLSLDILKTVDDFYTDVEPAFIHAAGPIGIDAFKADADIESIQGSIKLGHTDFTLNQQRAYSVRNPQYDAEKNPDVAQRIEKSGRMSIKRDVPGNKAAYNRAVNLICEMAGDAL